MNPIRFRPHLLIAIALAATAWMATQPPIHQSLDYHRFVDVRTILGVPNLWNIASNLPFVLVGVAGLAWAWKHRARIEAQLRSAWLVFFTGLALVGLGSSWYHYAPDSATLVWDRLPMTIAFMAFFAAILGEYIDLRLGKKLLWPLLAVGVLSVGYWRAVDDLRPYALVQFLPMLLIPLVLLLYPKPGSGAVWLALACYVAAKLLELFDGQVYQALGQLISGHSLKHLVAAAGMWLLLVGLKRRHSASIHASAPVPG